MRQETIDAAAAAAILIVLITDRGLRFKLATLLDFKLQGGVDPRLPPLHALGRPTPLPLRPACAKGPYF